MKLIVLPAVMLTLCLRITAAADEKRGNEPAGTPVVMMEVRFLSLDHDSLKELGLQAETIVPPETEVPPGELPAPAPLEDGVGENRSGVIRLVSASTVTEVRQPVSFQLLDNDAMFQLISKAQSRPAANLMFAPKLQLQSGETGEIKDTILRSLVTDVDGEVPQITQVEDGTVITVRPDVLEDGSISLQLRVSLSETKDIRTGQKQNGQEIQIPEIARTRLHVSSQLQNDQSLAVWGPGLESQQQVQITKRTLFRTSTALAIKRSQLVLLVTPRISRTETQPPQG